VNERPQQIGQAGCSRFPVLLRLPQHGGHTAATPLSAKLDEEFNVPFEGSPGRIRRTGPDMGLPAGLGHKKLGV
jgi:hypothetical protein